MTPRIYHLHPAYQGFLHTREVWAWEVEEAEEGVLKEVVKVW
jgi:hypothetical protein